MKITTLLTLLLGTGAIAQTPFFHDDTATGSYFGYQTKMAGNEMLVSTGAYMFNPTNYSAPTVVLYEKTPSDIAQRHVFSQPDGLATDGFGSSIALEGENVAIGAPYNEDGAVYTFKRNGDTWDFFQKITSGDLVTANDRFGTVALHGDYLFIGAPEDDIESPNNDNFGSVHVYQYNGSEWFFLTKLVVPGTLNFGSRIKAENDFLAVGSVGAIHIFKLVSGLWEYQGSSPAIETLRDFVLQNNEMYVVEGYSTQQIEVFDYTQLNWQPTATVPAQYNDQLISTVEVLGDNMFVGSDGYILQMMRKFPLQYFKKINGTWTFQNVFYGNSSTGDDDFFGKSISGYGDNLVIGAPGQTLPIHTGMAYYLNMQELGVDHFNNVQIALFPNPVVKMLSIGGIDPNAIAKIEVRSLTGQLIFASRNTTADVDLSAISSGVYLLTIYLDSGITIHRKVIKN
ncbi:MAG: T9SS type A sorting domain-containing protein [Flavobacterium sp.]|nr:MAG: T9SS type A sorting domain-containing protein [Flavobacterium sp.]